MAGNVCDYTLSVQYCQLTQGAHSFTELEQITEVSYDKKNIYTCVHKNHRTNHFIVSTGYLC